jgi:hypothetical protein
MGRKPNINSPDQRDAEGDGSEAPQERPPPSRVSTTCQRGERHRDSPSGVAGFAGRGVRTRCFYTPEEPSSVTSS